MPPFSPIVRDFVVYIQAGSVLTGRVVGMDALLDTAVLTCEDA